MNRLLLALTLGATFFCGQASAQADRQALSGYCEDGGQTVTSAGVTSTTKVQRSYPGCTVTVYESGTATLATIYADLAGTPKANPFTANGTTGYWFFYADPDRYDVQLSGAGMSTVTRGGLWIVASGGGGGGVSGSGTTNQIPKWTAATTLGNSIMAEVGGAQISVAGNFLVSGTQAIGTSPVSTTALTIQKTYSGSAASYFGTSSLTTISGISGFSSSYGNFVTLATSGAATNANEVGAIRAVYQHTGGSNISSPYGVYASVSQSGAGTVTRPVGVRSDLSLAIASSLAESSAFKSTATMTSGSYTQHMGFWSVMPTLSGGATITNHYGFRADASASTGSVTTFYPFYSSQGIVSFGNAGSDRVELRGGLPLRLWDPSDLGYSEILQNGTPAGNYRYYWPTDTPVTSDALTVSGVSGSNVTLAWTPGGGGAATNVRKALNVVTDYGCAGDGVTNDTTCINNALTAAAGSTGYKVYLPAGVYLVTGITITGQIEVEGDGDGKTIIYSTSNAPIVSLARNSDFRGPTLRNLTIRGDVTAGGSQNGLVADDATYVHSIRVSNVTVEDTGNYGLYVGNAYSSAFENMFLSNSVDYPLFYNGPNMPTNRFRSIYVGDLRTSAPTGFRIYSGVFTCTECNGINNTPTNARWAVVGQKTGVDGSASNSGAVLDCTHCNIESYETNGILAYSSSLVNLRGYTTLAGSTTGQKPIEFDLAGNGATFFSELIQRGVIEDSVVFGDGPLTNYANNQAVHANGFVPLQTTGQGPRVASDDPLSTFYNSTAAASAKLSRADGKLARVTVTTTTAITDPSVRWIEANCGAACTITLPWPGWYDGVQEGIWIKDISGAAATNNVTVAASSGGTVNGAANYAITQNGASLHLVPNETATDWRVVTQYPGERLPWIQTGGAINDQFFPVWNGTNGSLSLSSGLYNLSGDTVFTGHALANTDNTKDIGTSGGNRFRTIYAATGFSGPKYTVAGNIFWSSGAGSPEGVVTADIGSLYSRNNGTTNTTIYAKTSGAGNTGWEPLINTGGGGGSIGGTIAANQVAFGTAADTIGGDNDLQWDNSTKNLTVVGHATITQDNTATVPFSVQAVAASSAELAQFKDSGGNVRGGYSTAGAFFFRGFSSAPTASLANDGKLFYDITGGVTNQQLLLSKNTGTYNPVVTAEQASFTANRLVKWSGTAGSWQATDISGATSDGTNVTFGSANLRATRPRFVTSIDDTNGNELIALTATGSAVNELTLANAATGNAVTLGTSGGDTNINLNVTPKGSGQLTVNGTAVLLDPGANGIVTRTASGVTTARTITGTANQILVTDGDGVSGNPTLGAPQDLNTSANFQVGTLGVGTTPLTAGGVDILGNNIDTDANNTVAGINLAHQLTKNTSNTRTFYTMLVKPLINAGGSNNNTTLNMIGLDSTNTSLTGVTTNFINMAYGGTRMFTFGADGYLDIAETSAPSNPATNFGRLYLDSGTGDLACLDDAGGSCLPSGGGTPAGSTGDYQINNGGSFGAGVLVQGSTGRLTATPTAQTSGTDKYFRLITPADTGQTASTEVIGAQFGGNTSAATVTRTWAAGALTTQRENVFVAPTYAFASASTITTAATVAITGEPTAGTNATITTPLALLVSGRISSPGAGANSERFGAGSSAGGASSVAIGNGANASQTGSIAIGTNAQGTGFAYGTAIGLNSAATAGNTIAVGVNLTVSGLGSLAIDNEGAGRNHSGQRSILIGNGFPAANTTHHVIAIGVIPASVGMPGASGDVVFALNATNGAENLYAGKGRLSASPTAWTINGTGGNGSNIAGANINIAGGKSTGTGRSGHVSLQTSITGSSGSSLNSLVDRQVIPGRKTVSSNNSALGLFEIALPTLTGTGGTVRVTVYATDGTDVQSRVAVVRFSGVNKGGSYTVETAVVDEAISASAGTLTATYALTPGSNKVTFEITPNSSLTTTVYYVIFDVTNNSEQAVTIL